MRVSTPYQYGKYKSDIARAQSTYLERQSQVSTGKRFTKASEDPYGSASVLSLSAAKRATEQYAKNLRTAKTALSFSDASLDEIGKLFKRANELAVGGANSALTQDGRNAMAAEVGQLMQRLVDLGNSRDANGDYLFAGQMTDEKPFTFNLGVLQFNGDTNDITVESGPGETLKSNVTASTSIMTAYNTLKNLKESLEGGNVGQISGVDLAAVKASTDEFLQLRGQVGTSLQRIEQTNTEYTRRIDDFAARISDIEDVDIAEALVEYKQAENAYNAALNVASQGFRLSLMDFIRG